jgi:hypothetical protein
MEADGVETPVEPGVSGAETGRPDPPTQAEPADEGGNPLSPTTKSRLRAAGWGVAAAVVLLVVLSLITPGGRHQWALSFVRQPTPTTTLAFTHPADLPSAASSGSPVSVAFTVSNQEGRDLDYRYVVTSRSSAQSPAVLAHGVVPVRDGGRRSVSLHVVPRCTTSPCTVKVTLPGPGEAIDMQLDLQVPAQ